jgi:serine/threonine protein kinase/tetratricopeptide (TPR) repeat protein
MGSGQQTVPDSVPATLKRGASIGRYVVLGLVGRGGMGEVYGAYDPELNRKVAVKLLRVRPGNGVTPSEGRQRTLREAQAMASLSHPNVVVAYDVGTFGEKVFIAMEFVEGNTVTYWLAGRPRSWPEILNVFMAAGRGLAAAHSKGLVHRDFKPDNVMVGHDKQVRVMDFGLARQVSEKALTTGTASRPIPIRVFDTTSDADRETVTLDAAGAPSVPLDLGSPEPSARVLDLPLTRSGAMMGTPVYMAPEQFRGMPADARSDQFSFCIALYEALYGERPFASGNLTALATNVALGEVRSAPPSSRVPLWLRKILLRGLRPRVEERWPSMEDLIEALGKNPTVKRRNWALAGGAALAVTALALGVRPLLAERRQVCVGGPDKLAGIWDLPDSARPEPPSHAQIRSAFLQTGKSYAPDVFATVSRALTGYAQRWADMYKETCEATQVRGEQSPEVLDLRMSCLQERLGGLHALTSVFSEATGEVVEKAVSAANSLDPLDRCANVPLLRAVVKPPEDPATRAKVDELRIRAADLKARFDAGRWKQTLKDAPGLVAEARAVGYQPLVAEALMLEGNMLVNASNPAAAERSMVQAFWRADASRHDELRAEAAAKLVFVVGYQEGRFDEADHWATAARSVLERLGGHDLLQAWLLNDLGCVYALQGHMESAVEVMKAGLVLKEKALGPTHPDVGVSEGNLGLTLKEMGRNHEALAHVERAILLLEKGLGAGHPDLATQLSNRGEILNALGDYRDGRESFQRARAVWERELGPDSLSLGYALTGLGIGYLAEGNPTIAIVPLERAYRIRAAQETDPSLRAETTFALAQALWESDRARPRARTLAEEAKEAYATSADKAKLAEVERWLADRGSGLLVLRRP